MKIEFFSGRSLGIDIRLFLEVQPGAVQGLLLYKVCVDGPDWLPEEVGGRGGRGPDRHDRLVAGQDPTVLPRYLRRARRGHRTQRRE